MNPNEDYSNYCCSCEHWRATEIADQTGQDVDEILGQFGMCSDCREDEQFDN